MMQDWVLAASYHQSEKPERVWQSRVCSCMLQNLPACTCMLVQGYSNTLYKAVSHCTLREEQAGRVLSPGVSHSVSPGLAVRASTHRSLWSKLWGWVNSCTPQAHAGEHTPLLPHSSTPKFHLLLEAPPFSLVWLYIKLQDFWTWINFFLSIYDKYPGKEYSAHVKIAKCSTEMPKVASGEHGCCSPSVVATQLSHFAELQGLPTWTMLPWEDCCRYLSGWVGKKLLPSLSTALQHDDNSVEILRELWFN